MGIPSSLRGRVWKCLLAIDSLRDNSDFNYQVKYIETHLEELQLVFLCLNLSAVLLPSVVCRDCHTMSKQFKLALMS